MSSEGRKTETGGRDATRGVIPGRYALSVGNPGRPLPNGWRWTLLTDVARLETGHTPARKEASYWDGDIPWIGIRDATGNHGRVIDSTKEFISESGLANSSARLLPAKTVCLSRTASVGYVVVMGQSMATSQDFVNWVCGDSLNWRFLVYTLMAERDAMSMFASGTTHQTIYFPEVKAFHIALPSPSEQRRIAWVLGTLDDKIELNRKMAQTLEETAAAIFKARFVDFEGVEEFEDSEIGAIPKGWPVSSVGSVATVIKGKSYKSDELESSSTALVTLKSIKRGGGYSQEGAKPFTGEFKEAQVVQPGEIVLAHTDLTQARDVIGRTAVVEETPPFTQLVASLDLAIIRPNEDAISKQFLLGVLQSRRFIEHAFAHSNGSTVLHLNSKAAGDFRFAIPPAEERREYERLVEPIRRWSSNLTKERLLLQSLRDQLLPKLISGKIRVPEGVGPDLDEETATEVAEELAEA